MILFFALSISSLARENRFEKFVVAHQMLYDLNDVIG